MAKTKETYEVAQDGFLFGDFYKAGTTIELYPEQARYDLPPHGSMLKAPSSGASDAHAASAPASAQARRAAPGASDAKRGSATTSAPEGAN